MIDGLIYPSIQTGLAGQNIVLFPTRSNTAAQDYIRSSDDDFADILIDMIDNDDLPPTLKFKSDSLRFHRITAIKTESEISEDPDYF